MVSKKSSTPPSLTAETTNGTSPINPVISTLKSKPWLAGGIAVAAAVAIVEAVLMLGSTVDGVSTAYRDAVNSADIVALDNTTLFPTEGEMTRVPDFINSSITPFTVTDVDAELSETGDSATLTVHTTEGVEFTLDASKHYSWVGPFYSMNWQIDSPAPTIRVSPDTGLNADLKFTFNDLPYTVNEVATLASPNQTFAVLPGVLRYDEPAFGFLAGGEQKIPYTTGSSVLTLGPSATAVEPELVKSSVSELKKSVKKCSNKKKCTSLPKYKNKEFKVKTPAGSWDHLSVDDTYKLKNCDVANTEFVSAVEARVSFDCDTKVTRYFVWSDTYTRGFVFWFWYFSWTETAYKSDHKSLNLTIDGEIAVTFDPSKEKFSANTVGFTSTKG